MLAVYLQDHNGIKLTQWFLNFKLKNNLCLIFKHWREAEVSTRQERRKSEAIRKRTVISPPNNE
jgi:hypothetical protein